ncbi:RmlC-like cupin domain-containing protein [Aspergillus sergii]|uniref:cysteine dioxygenase n=1 Tax=Aspergillus sergii TaxID=1034303 RepID=A0A5N6X1X4_9EURO|nr:RmlC-like cupin domain-containing protein [Aspergillus sergii]
MADPEHFTNPFWDPEPDEILSGRIPYSSIEPAAGIEMTIGGLGTIAVRSKTTGTLEFIVRSAGPDLPTLKLTVTAESCVLQMKDNDSKPFRDIPVIEFPTEPRESEGPKKLPYIYYPKQPESAYLNVQSKTDPTVYWISVDRSNKRFRYGQHLTNASLTYLEAHFDGDRPSKQWMDQLKSTEIQQNGREIPTKDVRYDPLPVTMDKPPLVISDEQVSLEDLDKYTRTTYANLPPGCQDLYHNIAGHNVSLESPSFPQLAQAIDYSCRDPKLVCGKILEEKKKKDEFHDKLKTYLRITVGNNLANSPGIPYVMEIWPPGHSSPIHDHGKASAVIKVLYGSIDCSWYDAVQDGRKPQQVGKTTKLSKGDVTWLGDKQFQIHKLQNSYKTVCITLQCYQFEKSDKEHYEYFDFLDNSLHKDRFVPNSDSSYSKLVEELKIEWNRKH